MLRFKGYFLFALLIFFFSACKKDEKPSPVESEYIIFGHFYGMCGGEQCVEIFKWDCCHIYEDTNDNYPSITEKYKPSFIELNYNEHDSVSFLMNSIPAELFSENQKVIGMPDAGDWGGLYFEIKQKDQEVKYWYIDQMKANVPVYLHSFIDDINTAIKRLQ